MLQLLQQSPIIVDVSEPPAQVARDISIDVVLGVFATAGAFLLAAAVGCLVVAAGIVLIKRWRDASSSSADANEPSHTRLRI